MAYRDLMFDNYMDLYCRKLHTHTLDLIGPSGPSGPTGLAQLTSSSLGELLVNGLPISSTGALGPTGSAGPTGHSATGATGPAGPAGSGSGSFADFYAVMPGDNAATVAVNADVLFPNDGPASSDAKIVRTSTSAFKISDIGDYQVYYQVSVDEAGQLELTLNNAVVAGSVAGRATGTSQISNLMVVHVTTVDSILTVRNPAGNSTALTITPIAGGTVGVSAQLVISKVGGGAGPTGAVGPTGPSMGPTGPTGGIDLELVQSGNVDINLYSGETALSVPMSFYLLGDKICHLVAGAISGTTVLGPGTYPISTGAGVIPVSMRPSSDIYLPCCIVNNSTDLLGICKIFTNGAIVFNISNLSGFTADSTCGWSQQEIIWSV